VVAGLGVLSNTFSRQLSNPCGLQHARRTLRLSRPLDVDSELACVACFPPAETRGNRIDARRRFSSTSSRLLI